MNKFPSRGEIWFVNLGPTLGHEQSGKRPALIVSVDAFNYGPANLVIVIPITSKYKGIPLHVEIVPPDGGVKRRSFVKCEDIRSISKERLLDFVGTVSTDVMKEVEERLRILIGL